MSINQSRTNKLSSKLHLDKYYTPSNLAEYVVDKTNEIIGADNIIEYLEPSAGEGVFLNYFNKPYRAYDIEPDDNSRILRCDFLKLDLEYKEGRCVIGNPPFGEKNNMSRLFFRKSIELGDYIAFILPISQLNNNYQMYQFELIYSEDLGKVSFSNERDVHVCLNIFKRPEHGGFNKRNVYKLKDVELKEVRKSRNQYLPKDWVYDIGICIWGSVGEIIEREGTYQQELYIKVNNKDLREQVLTVIENTDWCEEYYMTKSPSLMQWQVYRHLKKQIPEIE